MPRFFFHVQDGQFTPDRTGVELDDIEEARNYAIGLSGKILSREKERFWDGCDWQISAVDEQGNHLFSLNFQGSSAEDHPSDQS